MNLHHKALVCASVSLMRRFEFADIRANHIPLAPRPAALPHGSTPDATGHYGDRTYIVVCLTGEELDAHTPARLAPYLDAIRQMNGWLILAVAQEQCGKAREALRRAGATRHETTLWLIRGQ